MEEVRDGSEEEWRLKMSVKVEYSNMGVLSVIPGYHLPDHYTCTKAVSIPFVDAIVVYCVPRLAFVGMYCRRS